MLMIEDKLKALFPLAGDKDPRSEHEYNAFTQQAKTLYKKFEQAPTYRQMTEAANELIQHVKKYHHITPSSSVDNFELEVEMFWSFLREEMRKRFLAAYVLEEKWVEALALDKQKQEQKEKQQQVLGSYEKAAKAEEKKKREEENPESFIGFGERPLPTLTRELPPVYVEQVVENLLDEDLESDALDGFLDTLIRSDGEGNVWEGPLTQEQYEARNNCGADGAALREMALALVLALDQDAGKEFESKKKAFACELHKLCKLNPCLEESNYENVMMIALKKDGPSPV